MPHSMLPIAHPEDEGHKDRGGAGGLPARYVEGWRGAGTLHTLA